MNAVKKKSFWKETRLFGIGITYLLPTFLILGVFLFYPITKTILFSFSDVKDGGVVAGFVGLEHYLALFSSPSFLNSLKVTFLFVLYTVPLTIGLSLFLAVIANEKLKGNKFFQMIFSSQ